MKKILLLAALLSTSSVYAQNTTANAKKEVQRPQKEWKVGGTTGINMSQVTLSNWAAGGDNSIAGNAFANVYANYSHEKIIWGNKLDVGYGLIRKGSSGQEKTEDRIDLLSSFSRQIKDSRWYYTGLLNFRTQFADGFDLKGDDPTKRISTFMAPGYLEFSAGTTYIIKDLFSLYLGPIATKTTFVMDDELSNQGAFGVQKGDNYRFEVGANVRFQFKKDVAKNVTFQLNGNFFSNYRENPQNIDVNLDALLDLKVNDWLSANISVQTIYDDDIKINDMGPRLQYKHVMAIGLVYKFKNHQ
ncbi:DUF3078 domain-containing protein [Persicobacter psychrovividus]|uniref:DUF3078 domain-containing protein n=1 Tax=Persicobacter psychrovividus TaxID=387638 RepID=A0ABN6L842_9BACT|nr:hypothetical protein PEPS_15640 [Persicobacter psychrovividus]